MNPLDAIYKFIFNLFYGFNTTGNEEVDPILSKMEDDGYSYDKDNEWWVRVWTTNQGRESIREVYQKLENGTWNKLMIGYGDNIFYEQKVGNNES